MASLNPQLLQAVAKLLSTKRRKMPVTSDDLRTEARKAGIDDTGAAKTKVNQNDIGTGPDTDNFGKDFLDDVEPLAPTKMGKKNPRPVEIFDRNAASSLDNRDVIPDTSDAANVPIRADEVVNPNRQKAAGLDLEGEKIGMQMDKIQEIINADPGLSALSPALLKESMPNVISNNRDKLGIKNDVRQVSTSVFEKLNDLAESAATDPNLSKQIQVMRAQAAQANERSDYKTLQLMLEQLTGTDAGLEGLSRFGRGRPTVPNDPTSLPINIPSKDKTATMEQIMKAVTQELGIK